MVSMQSEASPRGERFLSCPCLRKPLHLVLDLMIQFSQLPISPHFLHSLVFSLPRFLNKTQMPQTTSLAGFRPSGLECSQKNLPQNRAALHPPGTLGRSLLCWQARRPILKTSFCSQENHDDHGRGRVLLKTATLSTRP